MNKSYVKGIFKLIVFLLILCMCLQIVHFITKRKDSYQKMEDFFEQEEDFDVLFFGSSHMRYTIFPRELWKKQGIISYNLANYNETIVGSYYNMLLALKHTSPKLVVIDAYGTEFSYKYREDRIGHIHNMLDAYPLSYTKYLAIKDLFSNQDMLDKCFEFLLNFSLYHSRWSELEKDDFEIVGEKGNGAEEKISIAVPNEMSDFNLIDMYSGKENINMKYLRKIIEYCKQNEIQVLVTYIPYPATKNQISISKYLQVICDQYNVNYINFLSMDIVNYNTDCYDKDSHLNPSGARKVTDYIGKYIMDNYDILDQRKNKAFNFWYTDYNEYVDYKISNLNKNKKNLNNYLMLLYGEEDIKYEITISSKLEIKEGSTLYNLLNNLNDNYIIKHSAFDNGKTIKITTWDNRNGKLISTVWW